MEIKGLYFEYTVASTTAHSGTSFDLLPYKPVSPPHSYRTELGGYRVHVKRCDHALCTCIPKLSRPPWSPPSWGREMWWTMQKPLFPKFVRRSKFYPLSYSVCICRHSQKVSVCRGPCPLSKSVHSFFSYSLLK